MGILALIIFWPGAALGIMNVSEYIERSWKRHHIPLVEQISSLEFELERLDREMKNLDIAA